MTARYLSNLAAVLSPEGIIPAAKGGTGNTSGGGNSPTITSIAYIGNDTATNIAGGDTVTLTGTNFNTGVNVLIGTTQATQVTRISATQLTFLAPANAAGSYILYVVNTDGSTALAVPGLQYSGFPAWTTAAGSLGISPKAISFSMQPFFAAPGSFPPCPASKTTLNFFSCEKEKIDKKRNIIKSIFFICVELFSVISNTL